MPPIIPVTGPVGYFVNTGSSGYELLGTTERRPRIRWRREWGPVYNDIGGAIPFDMQYMGKDALIIGDFTRPDLNVLHKLQNLPRMENGPEDFYGDELGDIGSLMIQEGLAAELILVFPYGSSKSTQIAGGQRKGVHFLATWLLGPDEDELGSMHEVVRCVFHALRVYDPEAVKLTLCDFEIPDLTLSSAA